MKNKKIVIMTIMSLFLLVNLTVLSVTGMKTEKDTKDNEIKFKPLFARIDGEVFQSYSTRAVNVKGINNFLIAKDITVKGTVPYSLTASYEFIIDPLFGPKMIYEPGDSVDIHINTMLLPSIGAQCTPPYINSISGPAFDVTIY